MTDLTPNDLSHLSDEEFLALCPQGEHAPGPEPLSPAARAVFETFNSKFEWIEDGVPGPQFHAIAAALRALADQVVPERLLCTRTAEERTLYHEGRLDAAIRIRAAIRHRHRTGGPMTTDFRALCAELVKAFKDENTYTQRVEALDRAHATLATPPPKPPTDQEIQEWADAKLGAAEQGDPDAFGQGWRCFHRETFARTIRAALERWGR